MWWQKRNYLSLTSFCWYVSQFSSILSLQSLRNPKKREREWDKRTSGNCDDDKNGEDDRRLPCAFHDEGIMNQMRRPFFPVFNHFLSFSLFCSVLFSCRIQSWWMNVLSQGMERCFLLHGKLELKHRLFLLTACTTVKMFFPCKRREQWACVCFADWQQLIYLLWMDVKHGRQDLIDKSRDN